MSDNKDLIILENKTVTDVFMEDNGIDGILEEIAKRAREHDLDVTTDKGRKEIASVAFKIARSKTTLDNAGKDLTEEWRDKTKTVNESRRKARDFLDNLKDEIRKPLTEYENAEKERVSVREARIKDLDNLTSFANIDDGDTDIIEMCKIQLSKIDELLDFDWQEFKAKAEKQADIFKEYLTNKLNNAINAKEQRDRIAKEAEEKRLAEQEAREKEIARLAKEQAEKEAQAKIEAERKAKEEAEARAKAQEEARIKAEQEAKVREEQRIAREKAEAEEKAKAEAEAKAKEERSIKVADKTIEDMHPLFAKTFKTTAEYDAYIVELNNTPFAKGIETINQSNRVLNEADKLIQNMKTKREILAEEERKHAEEEKRLANEAYIKSKKTETYKALQELGDFPPLVLRDVVNAIYEGKIPNVKVEV